MKKIFILVVLAAVFSSCNNDLEFKTVKFYKKTTMPCKQGCPQVTVIVPIAQSKSVVSDSINNRIFSVVQSIVYNEEARKTFSDYDALLSNFINQYERTQNENPQDVFGWEAEVKGKIVYRSEQLINFEITHYSYTGGAHGYSGKRSIIMNPETGKVVVNKNLFVNEAKFKAFAEKKFRSKFKIPTDSLINSVGFMFEEETFQLPQSYFFTKNGLLLHYNTYEIASYAQGPQDLLLSYGDLKPYLKVQ